uniref:Uncharacterized protein n=1 Tax=viral metagenome TaxID=1070528 RepID=A0A6C0IZB2_9ZZZZ
MERAMVKEESPYVLSCGGTELYQQDRLGGRLERSEWLGNGWCQLLLRKTILSKEARSCEERRS